MNRSSALVVMMLVWVCSMQAQKIGYVSTDAIREQYESSKQAQERLDAYVDEWKQELAQRQRDIDELDLEIKKNRLIWSDQERTAKEKDIEEKRRDRDQFARIKFEPGGEHDQQAEQLFRPVWTKIYTAVQKVSAQEGYDMVWDKSTQPLVYVNAKYDITVKVMKELGIDAGDLEAKQKEAIDGDPRNKRQEEPRRRKSRRTATDPSAAPSTPTEPTPVPLNTPAIMDSGLMPNGLPPSGQTPGGGPSHTQPVPATDTTGKGPK
ncbi:MAG: OmpH family outer membrane protein [Ignavibacteria bacterium]|jgi:outer membrane protein